MPDSRMSDKNVGLALNMKALARVHYFYVRGVESAPILTEKQVRTHYRFIEQLEKILLQSGYMTEAEVKAVHFKKKPEVINDLSVSPFPFDA